MLSLWLRTCFDFANESAFMVAPSPLMFAPLLFYFDSEDFNNFTMKNGLSCCISSRQVVVAFEIHTNISLPLNPVNAHWT